MAKFVPSGMLWRYGNLGHLWPPVEEHDTPHISIVEYQNQQNVYVQNLDREHSELNLT